MLVIYIWLRQFDKILLIGAQLNIDFILFYFILTEVVFEVFINLSLKKRSILFEWDFFFFKPRKRYRVLLARI